MEQIFNKLVRDKIPNKIESNGEVAITRTLDNNEYNSELEKKLLEECGEVISANDSEDKIEELADVLEIIRSIAKLEDKSLEDVIEVANKKRDKRGSFDKRIFLVKTYKK